MAKRLQLRLITSTGQAVLPDRAGNISLRPNERIILTGAGFGEELPNGSVKWIAELPCGKQDDPQVRFIPWQNPAISFTTFLLNNFTPGVIGACPLEDGDHTPASALHHVIRQHETEKGEATWLQCLFGVPKGSNAVERRYLDASHNNTRRTYAVKLRLAAWKEIHFEVLSGARTLAPSCYSNLAEHVIRSFTRRQTPQTQPLLDVLVYDWEQADYVSIRETRAVRHRSALKIAIHPTRSGHYFLVWINSDRQIHTLYPFSDWKWSPPAQNSPVNHPVVLPLPSGENSPQAYYIDTPRGVETVMLLERDGPLSHEQIQELKNEVERLSPAQPAEPPESPCERHWPEASPKSQPADQPRLTLGAAPESSAIRAFLARLIDSLKPFSRRVAALSIPNEGGGSS